MTDTNAAAAADDGKGIPADMLAETAATEQAGADVEGLAKRLGWKPKEQFDKAPERWQDAETFVKRAQEELPGARARLAYQDRMIKDLQSKIEESAKLTKEQGESLKELLDRSRGAEARGLEYAREQVRARIKQAAADADTAAVDAAMRDLDDLNKMKAELQPKKIEEPPANTKKAPDPEVVAWTRENKWFNTNKAMHLFAVGREEEILQDEPYLSTKERLDKVAEEARRRWPEEFENKARRQPPAASQPGPQGTRSAKPKQKTADDLPAEDRSVMQRLVKQKVLTEAQYLKDYKW